ncbi:hypothetical protein KM043_009908 [Ampulex compressa]|nr:hypothetical protein KM043_009908 [Ampulex compressa]
MEKAEKPDRDRRHSKLDQEPFSRLLDPTRGAARWKRRRKRAEALGEWNSATNSEIPGGVFGVSRDAVVKKFPKGVPPLLTGILSKEIREHFVFLHSNNRDRRVAPELLDLHGEQACLLDRC